MATIYNYDVANNNGPVTDPALAVHTAASTQHSRTLILLTAGDDLVISCNPSMRYQIWHKGFTDAGVVAIDKVKVTLDGTAADGVYYDEMDTEILSPGDVLTPKINTQVLRFALMSTVGGAGSVILSIATTESMLAGTEQV